MEFGLVLGHGTLPRDGSRNPASCWVMEPCLVLGHGTLPRAGSRAEAHEANKQTNPVLLQKGYSRERQHIYFLSPRD
jgi:hypothetical protein